jgi:hypothetical protein
MPGAAAQREARALGAGIRGGHKGRGGTARTVRRSGPTRPLNDDTGSTPSAKTLVAAKAAGTGLSAVTRIRGVVRMRLDLVPGPVQGLVLPLGIAPPAGHPPPWLRTQGADHSAGMLKWSLAAALAPMRRAGLLGGFLAVSGWRLWRHRRLERRG